MIINEPNGGFFDLVSGITFDGGDQNSDGNSQTTSIAGINTDAIPDVLGDTLQINHATPVEADTVTHIFLNDSDGSIVIDDTSISDGTATITYTGLEPILDNLSAADRVFNFTSSSDEMITLKAGGLAGQDNFIDSDIVVSR